MKKYIIGIEGGGSYTRGVVTETSGRIIASKVVGCGNPYQDKSAKSNIQLLLKSLLQETSISGDEVLCISAGLAGVDEAEDLKWAEEYLSIPELKCNKIINNDSKIVHDLAFDFAHGIVAIAGTGSIVKGINEEGSVTCNYDFNHYARISSRNIAYSALYTLVQSKKRVPWQRAVLKFFQCESVQELYHKMSNFKNETDEDIHRKVAKLAPIITTYAVEGEPIARQICDKAIEEIIIGIDLVASSFESSKIPICLVGSVLQSFYISENLQNKLLEESKFSFDFVKVTGEPVLGAIAIALKQVGYWRPIMKEQWANFRL